jgi:cellulose synthase/poly-beta-1,6-N-acetylglucosamine synthase-like glycosyltransferase
VLYLQVLVFLLCLAALGYYGFSLYATIAFFRSQPNEPTETFTPPVTILKPLCGLDWESYDCLASFCQQDYPEYQLVFTLQDSQDPSLAIVEKLQRDFPALNIEFLISDRHLGINPKINNLANGFNLARYDLFVISDSDIQVKNDYLKAIIQPFKELMGNIFGVSESTGGFGEILIEVGAFLGEVFQTLGTVIGVLIKVFDFQSLLSFFIKHHTFLKSNALNIGVNFTPMFTDLDFRKELIYSIYSMNLYHKVR